MLQTGHPRHLHTEHLGGARLRRHGPALQRKKLHTPQSLDRVLFAETPAAAAQDVYSHEDPLVTLLVSAAVITLFTLSYLASMAARCSAT